MLCAIVNNNVVEQVRDVTQEEFDQGIANKHQAVISVEGLYPVPLVGWLLSNNVLVSPNVSYKISNLAFMNRLTSTEYNAILEYIDDHSKPYHYYVQQLMNKLNAAKYIDLGRSDTISGANLIANLGIITHERCNEILTTVPTYIELYKGND
jgi:hypothetical protein